MSLVKQGADYKKKKQRIKKGGMALVLIPYGGLHSSRYLA